MKLTAADISRLAEGDLQGDAAAPDRKSVV